MQLGQTLVLVSKHPGWEQLIADQIGSSAWMKECDIHPFVVRFNGDIVFKHGILCQLVIASEGGSVQCVALQGQLGGLASGFCAVDGFNFFHVTPIMVG